MGAFGSKKKNSLKKTQAIVVFLQSIKFLKNYMVSHSLP